MSSLAVSIILQVFYKQAYIATQLLLPIQMSGNKLPAIGNSYNH
jgi:hypothetical protein